MKAKLIEGKLTFYVPPMNPSNDYDESVATVGYKEVIDIVGTNGIWEDETNIYVERPPVPTSIARAQEFKRNKIIYYKEQTMSVDEAVVILNSYQIEGRLTEVEELKALIIDAKNKIRAKYSS
jgi:hypothetical protein